jgi:hypothetical protein
LLEALSYAGFVRKGLTVKGIEDEGKKSNASDGVRLALSQAWPGGIPERFEKNRAYPERPPVLGAGIGAPDAATAAFNAAADFALAAAGASAAATAAAEAAGVGWCRLNRRKSC